MRHIWSFIYLDINDRGLPCIIYVLHNISGSLVGKAWNPETKWWRSKCCWHKDFPGFIQSLIIFIHYHLSAHWIRKWIFLFIIRKNQYMSSFEIMKCNITYHVSLTFNLKGSTSTIISSTHSKMNCNRMQSNNCFYFMSKTYCRDIYSSIFCIQSASVQSSFSPSWGDEEVPLPRGRYLTPLIN